VANRGRSRLSLFVTIRLQGSLPLNRIFPPAGIVEPGKAFVALDRLLDRGHPGPVHRRRPEIAELVVTALRDGERRFHRYSRAMIQTVPAWHARECSVAVILAAGG
jgi:hypothetical protein